MGLFGRNEEKEAENAAMAAELARLEALPLEQLAEEVLLRGYGPDGPGADGSGVSIAQLVARFNPATSVFGIDERVRSAYPHLICEGVQVLEHARWVVMHFSGGDHASLGWAITRAGRAALAGGQPGRALTGAV